MQQSNWHNWHNTTNVGGPVQKEFTPNNGATEEGKDIQNLHFKPGLDALLAIVKDAMNDGGAARIRAFGSKWSLNNAAYTPDYMVKTWGLNYAKIGFAKNMVTQAYKDKADKLCFVQAGVMIHYLNQALFAKNLALQTTGASDGQRLIGAISTGTHGSAMHVGAMQEYVKGIHLVIPDGDSDAKHVFLQRKSDQAVNKSFATFMDNTVLIDDDELFNAAVVGFGCFGLIHGLLIETEDLFLLNYQTVRFNPNEPWYKDRLQTVLGNPTRKNIRALARKGSSIRLFDWLKDEDGYPYFFSVTQNPYTSTLNPRTFFIEVMEKLPYDHNKGIALAPFSRKHEKHEAIDKGLKKNRAAGLSLTKGELSVGIQLGLKVFHHDSLIPRNASLRKPTLTFPNIVFNTKSSTNPVTTAPCPASSTEIAVPFSHVNEAVACVIEVLQDYLLAAPLGIRYIPKSLATLAVNQYEDFTVTIELPGPQKGSGALCSLFPDAEVAHNAVFEALNQRNIPHRFHWGQQLPMNTNWVTNSYGAEKVAAWKSARTKLLPSAKAQNIFANKLTDAVGLTGDALA